MNQFYKYFESSGNPLISFFDTFKNQVFMMSRKRSGKILIFAIFSTVLGVFIIKNILNIGFFYGIAPWLDTVLIIFIFIFGILMGSYLIINRSPIYKVKGIKFLEKENGFWIEKRNGNREFINYDDIISVDYLDEFNYKLWIYAYQNIRNLIPIPVHFLIVIKNGEGGEREIRIPFNIKKIYGLMSIILNNVSSEKRKNIQLLNGESIIPTRSVVLVVGIVVIWFFILISLFPEQFYKIWPPVIEAVKKVVEEKIKLFGSENKI